MPLTDHERQVVERLAVVETQVGDLRQELARTRERLHEIEGDRATLKLVVEQITRLGDGMPKIVDEAAMRAVELALEGREELERKRLGMRIQMISVGIALGGFLVSIAYFFSAR